MRLQNFFYRGNSKTVTNSHKDHDDYTRKSFHKSQMFKYTYGTMAKEYNLEHHSK